MAGASAAVDKVAEEDIDVDDVVEADQTVHPLRLCIYVAEHCMVHARFDIVYALERAAN
jgi:hypothetical protein